MTTSTSTEIVHVGPVIEPTFDREPVWNRMMAEGWGELLTEPVTAAEAGLEAPPRDEPEGDAA